MSPFKERANLTSQATTSFVFALDGCQADRFLTLIFIIVTIRLQVTAAQAPLVLFFPHPPLLGLSADGSSQTFLLFLQKQQSVEWYMWTAAKKNTLSAFLKQKGFFLSTKTKKYFQLQMLITTKSHRTCHDIVLILLILKDILAGSC